MMNIILKGGWVLAVTLFVAAAVVAVLHGTAHAAGCGAVPFPC